VGGNATLLDEVVDGLKQLCLVLEVGPMLNEEAEGADFASAQMHEQRQIVTTFDNVDKMPKRILKHGQSLELCEGLFRRLFRLFRATPWGMREDR
jgi:hypothetical protein